MEIISLAAKIFFIDLAVNPAKSVRKKVPEGNARREIIAYPFPFL